MAKNNAGNSGGIGFTGLLQIVFIALKLTKVISWSWWWVLAPMWSVLAIYCVVGIVVALNWAHNNK